jgi:WD40 repeat protein
MHTVRPVIVMESHSEVLTFRFNPVNPGFVAGGCLSGQVVLWNIGDRLEIQRRRGSAKNKFHKDAHVNVDEADDINGMPRHPVFVSSVDHSHNKAVADLFWLPPNTQISHRGHLVAPEHLDGKSHQFVTVAGDGQVMVWDTRFESIFNDVAGQFKFVGRPKDVPAEKSSSKEGKPVWAPIFKVHLKRFEGVGEYSLCKACCTGSLKSAVASKSTLPGDYRTHIITTTEEGDVLFVDLNTQSGSGRVEGKDDEDDERTDNSGEFVRWSADDQSRPSVALQQSPFFPDIIVTVGDWNFHIWKVNVSSGNKVPLFVSPTFTAYLSACCWSPTRPAVLLVSTVDGYIHAWDFTDTSYKASISFKTNTEGIRSMQYLLEDTKNRQQLLAVGDREGRLAVYEMPQGLRRALPNEDAIMEKFLDRELQRQSNKLDSSGAAENKSIHNAAFSFDNQQANVIAEASAKEDDLKLADRQREKELDEFVKMELAFIDQLALDDNELPNWVKQAQ